MKHDQRPVRVITNGVTGRMGYRQHMVRSLLAIRDDGGIGLPDGDRITVDPILVGRNAEKLATLAAQHGLPTTPPVSTRRSQRLPDPDPRGGAHAGLEP